MKIGQFRRGTTPNRHTTLNGKQIVGRNAGKAGIFGQQFLGGLWVVDFLFFGLCFFFFLKGVGGGGGGSQSDCMPSHTQKNGELEMMSSSIVVHKLQVRAR